MNTIKVGDFVRSFDFVIGKFGKDLEGDRASFVEGQVVDFTPMGGCQRYAILVTKDVFGGEEQTNRVGTTVYPPVNGTPTLMGLEDDELTNNVELMF